MTRDLSNTTTAQDDDILKGFENIIGGTGDDSFKGNSLNNIFNGNSGDDTVDYTNATAKIVANLNSTTKTVVSGSDNDTLLNIDKIIGSNYSDTFYSDLSGNNTFVGGTQADGTAADVVDYSQMIVSDATKDYVYLDLSTSSATVKQNSQVTASDTFSEIEKFVLTSGNDTIKGNDQANTMDGGAGSDTVRYDYLNSGNSVIVNFNTASASTTIAGDIDTYVSIENAYGSLGDDTFIMNATDNIENIVDGGIDGVDTISYQNYTTKVTVNLGATDGINTVKTGDTDTILNIENLIGGSAGDELTGNDQNNQITGGAGADTIHSSRGTDIINGSTSAADIDIMDYSNRNNGITLSTSGSTYTITKTDDSNSVDTLTNIEVINGTTFVDIMDGGTGNDTFNAGLGNDSLTGGAGNDRLNGEAGDDTLSGDLGNDILDGGSELTDGDTVTYESRTEKVTVNLDNSGNATVTVGVSGESDTLIDIENIAGSTVDDDITGNDSVNTLFGMSGNDTLKGEGGNDYIDGGLGDDIIYGGAGSDALKGNRGADTFIQTVGETTGDNIDGGSETDGTRGNDTVNYSAFISAAGIKVSLNDTSLANVTIGSNVSDHTLTNIENVIGSSGTDTIEGDTANNSLNGLSGTNDTLSFSKTSNGVFVNISGNSINSDIDGNGSSDTIAANTATGNEIGTDTVINFDDVIGGSGNDTIIGDGFANTLDGASGNDILVGGTGNDKLIGGAGLDTASYAIDMAGINVSLRQGSGTDGSSNTDTYDSIENILGSSYSDTIEGSIGNNILDGGAGIDTVTFENAVAGVIVNLSIPSFPVS